MRHLVAPLNQVVTQKHLLPELARRAEAAGSIVLATILITTVSLVNAVTLMTNQSSGNVKPALSEKAGGTPVTPMPPAFASGLLPQCELVPPELDVTLEILLERPPMIPLLDFQQMLRARNSALRLKENYSLLKNLDPLLQMIVQVPAETDAHVVQT